MCAMNRLRTIFLALNDATYGVADSGVPHSVGRARFECGAVPLKAENSDVVVVGKSRCVRVCRFDLQSQLLLSSPVISHAAVGMRQPVMLFINGCSARALAHRSAQKRI